MVEMDAFKTVTVLCFVTLLILVSLTLSSVGKIKNETVPSVQTVNSVLDVTVPVSAALYAEGTFVQPAGTKITGVFVVPLSGLIAATATGTGVRAGTASNAATDTIALAATALAATTDPVVLNKVYNATLIGQVYAPAERTLYFHVVSGTGGFTVAGVVRFVISYQYI